MLEVTGTFSVLRKPEDLVYFLVISVGTVNKFYTVLAFFCVFNT